MPTTQIIPATTPGRLDHVRTHFRKYASELNVDLCFHHLTLCP